MASTTLVQSGSGIICNQTSASTWFKQHLSKSFEGILARAADLIAGARRPGTSFNYESAQRIWVSWSGEEEINPHSCHLNFVLDFLAQLFEKKFEYSTINNYRSALSAYHDKVDNQPVGKIQKFVIWWQEYSTAIHRSLDICSFEILKRCWHLLSECQITKNCQIGI